MAAPITAAGSNSRTIPTYVAAYVEFVTRCRSSLTFKVGDLVRLERVKSEFRYPVGAEEFHFIHIVHGKVGEIDTFGSRSLCPLIDQGHLKLKEISLVEVTPMSHTSELVHLTCWIDIEIRRESVELVSGWLNATVGCKTHLMIRPGGPIDQCNIFWRVFAKWKTSKQFLMESTKDAAGIELSPPADVIMLELYEHQKRGLRWMIDREEWPELNVDNELPPFWEELNGVYRCELTGLITLKRPQNIRGGILADEPGMGKTLTLLSLIAHTKHSNIPASSLPTGMDAAAPPCNVRKKRKFSRSCLVNEEDVHFEWRPTLVVCPPSGLKQWKEQIQQCTCPGSLKICIYSGKSKRRDPNLIWRHNLVLATYNILVREEESDSGILNQIDWWRVVLDDAHVLNGFKSRFTTPFINLKAGRLWAVTGKPVHKDCENYNIYPIFKFLQFEPFCNKGHWMVYMNYSPISPSERQSRLEVLMGIFSLRRTMPVRFIENYLVVLSKDEQDLYNTMEAEAKKAIKLCPRNSQAIVLHLWQSCNSLASYLLSCTEIVASANFQDISGKPELLNKWVAVLQDEEDYACPICLDEPEDIVITRCTHLFCLRCIIRMFEKNIDGKSFCPMCRGSLSKHNIFCIQRGSSVEEKINSSRQIKSSPANMSSKVSSLLSLLLKSRKEDPHRKSVVISQFRKMLMLVKTVLSEAGFQVNCMGVIDDATRKAKTVEEFINAETPVVLLTTYKTLSKTPGLDLSATSTVYLMEPCLNAHTEDEALDRTHRVGKKDEVKFVRLVCKNTIEERVLEMRKHTKIAYGTSNSRKEVNLRGLDEIIKFLGF